LQPNFEALVPADLKSRITFQGHDFFTPQPVKHADVYFFKHILHDWSDEWAARILKQIVPVLRPDSSIVVLEGLVPPPGAAPGPVMRMMSTLDLQMLSALNAKERTVEDWTKLAKMADERLVVRDVKQPPGIAFATIEIGLRA